jgi:thioester reductase-like protein
MATKGFVLLTGATGTLGTFLLRDLLLGGRPVAVLVRDTPRQSAVERVAEAVAFWSDTLGRSLPRPTVLPGDLTVPGLGLSVADRGWLGRYCRIVIHAAADLSFRATAAGEPWRTNVEGTAALLDLCRRLGLTQFHYVSTAFVCGRRSGRIEEDDLERGQDFHNSYEESKFEAERLVRLALGVLATVYRPTVIVGDSASGYTAGFSGLYRVLGVAAQLAPPRPAGPRRLPLRLPLTGDELCNLVPVDWVSRAVVDLVNQPPHHGRTYHLASPVPAPGRLIGAAAAEVLGVEGVRFAGPEGSFRPTRLERLFWDGVREYWPYLAGNPAFDCTNTRAALPHRPVPPVDRALLVRLVRFAEADDWGRRRREQTGGSARDCADYVERFFPHHARRSRLARAVGLDLVVGIDLRGPGGGEWSCEWCKGELTSLTRGLSERAAVIYHLGTTAFDAVVSGRLTPQQAFFEQQIEVSGDLETALKLAVLFGHFLEEIRAVAATGTPALSAEDLPSSRLLSTGSFGSLRS